MGEIEKWEREWVGWNGWWMKWGMGMDMGMGSKSQKGIKRNCPLFAPLPTCSRYGKRTWFHTREKGTTADITCISWEDFCGFHFHLPHLPLCPFAFILNFLSYFLPFLFSYIKPTFFSLSKPMFFFYFFSHFFIDFVFFSSSFIFIACPVIQINLENLADLGWILVRSCSVGCGFWWGLFVYKAPLLLIL